MAYIVTTRGDIQRARARAKRDRSAGPTANAIARQMAPALDVRTQGEIQSSHLMIQEHFGWTVHTYHPEADNQDQSLVMPNGTIAKADHYVTTGRYRNKTRMNLSAKQVVEAARREKLRMIALRRDHVNATCFNDGDW